VLTTKVIDSKGADVLNKVTTLPVSGFDANRSMPYRFAVPVAGLKPGAYLLTFDASVGTVAAKRDIRFHVK
jgi:hypothetical protein